MEVGSMGLSPISQHDIIFPPWQHHDVTPKKVGVGLVLLYIPKWRCKLLISLIYNTTFLFLILFLFLELLGLVKKFKTQLIEIFLVFSIKKFKIQISSPPTIDVPKENFVLSSKPSIVMIQQIHQIAKNNSNIY